MKARRAKNCIYCRAAISRPPTEHVIPEAFGLFDQTAVLHCVCRNCNTLFGRQLEPSFARATGEGFARVYFKLRPGVLETSKNSVLTLSLPSHWEGARVRMHDNPNGERALFEVVPQVAIKHMKTWDWIIEGEISAERLAGYLDKPVDVRIVYGSNEQFERLTTRLSSLGVQFREVLPYDIDSLQDERLQALFKYEMSHVHARCVCKIAFNYLAWNLMEWKPDFVFHQSFDDLRNYILRGDLCGHEAFISVTHRSILREEQFVAKATNGHILAIDWSSDRGQVIAYLALFNSIRYRVVLSHGYDGIWFPLGIGHHFDVAKRKISRLLQVTWTDPLNPVQSNHLVL